MNSLIQDILDDPQEYLPVLFFLAILVSIWASLSLSGFLSLRTARRRRMFWFALGPLVFGWMGVWAQMPFSFASDEIRLSFDFRWIFLVPLLLGIAGVVRWWKVRDHILG